MGTLPVIAVLLIRCVAFGLLELVFAQLGMGIVLLSLALIAAVGSVVTVVVRKVVLDPALWVFDKAYAATEAAYVPLLKTALRAKWLLSAVAVAGFAWSVFAFGNLGTELLPSINQGQQNDAHS